MSMSGTPSRQEIPDNMAGNGRRSHTHNYFEYISPGLQQSQTDQEPE
jgi:hypothetical protein